MKEKREKKRRNWKSSHHTATEPRPPHSYRAFRRNAEFGRKPVGNTKPSERHVH